MMLKSKIARKLSLNFAVALLIFSLVISGIFLILFKNYVVDMHKIQLEKCASSLAQMISANQNKYYNENHGMGMMGQGYMHVICELFDVDVWIVDEDMNLITPNMAHGMTHRHHQAKMYKFVDLPSNASEVIKEVFTDRTVFSEGFSDVLSQTTLTVGVPIKNSSNAVVGAVLVHSPVSETAESTKQGLIILGISMILAMVIAFALSIFLSYLFTKPLAKMKMVALQLSQGNYKAQCDIKQDDEIGELAKVIDSLAVRLDEASSESAKLEQMRKDFVANISHELRTPITVIRGSLEALNEKVITEPQKVEQYHQQMLNEAKFLERLVGDLLDLSRLQNPDFIIEKQLISINDVLMDTIRSARHIAMDKKVEIIIDRDDIMQKNLSIQGDYGRLRQMFLIVLDNAIKFSKENGKVEISVIKDDICKKGKIIIRDYGKGILQEDLPYIFDRFYKTHDKSNEKGTGLGLAIAKEIAQRHNIALSAKNHGEDETEKKEGAEFIFKLQ